MFAYFVGILLEIFDGADFDPLWLAVALILNLHSAGLYPPFSHVESVCLILRYRTRRRDLSLS
jgi:TRAP-type mannitol/chloroaromatic compound transport system permease large subunit